MTQYNPNPSMKTNLTGWSKTGTGTFTSTADGGRVVVSAGNTVTITTDQFSIPTSAGGAQLAGVQVRRNSASANYGPYIVNLTSAGAQVGALTSGGSYSVGKFVRLSNIGSAQVSGLTRVSIDVEGPADLTITAVNVYNTAAATADVALDSNDAQWTYVAQDNSKVLAATYSGGNDEEVQWLRWDWGDGQKDEGYAGPRSIYTPATTKSHTYATAGTYEVSLTVRNKLSDPTSSYVLTKSVQVPSGVFSADFSTTADYLNLSVDGSPSIAPASDPITTYQWNWGDGTSATSGANPQASHQYAQPGTYNVKLTISNANRTTSTTQVVTAAAPPAPDNYFVASQKLLEVTFSPSITNGSSYAWSFGDGTTDTAQKPVHTYEVAGTYSVTLTVNGTQTTTQVITVTDTYTRLSSLNDALRLEVAVPHAAGVIYNRLANPSGEFGAFGWVTPVTGSYVNSSSTADLPADHGVSGSKLIYRSSGSGAQVFYSQSVKATAGQYASAQMNLPYVDGYARFAVQALDASGALLGSSAFTGYVQTSTTATVRTTAYLLPAGTAFARVRVDHYSTTSNGTPAAGQVLQMRRVMLAYAPSSSSLSANPYLEGVNWLNLLGPTSDLSWTRSALDVGTLSARVLDSSFDPATSGSIRPGQAIRVRCATRNSFGNVQWESAFTGRVRSANVDYVPVKVGSPGPKATTITLEATDNITELAAAPGSEGVGLISELSHVLEGVGVPYEINGSSGQVPTASVVSINPNASVLDQVAITRDSAAGYAYVDRHNVLKALDPQGMPSVQAGVIDEQAYADVDASFSTEDCINAVTIKWLRLTPASGEDEAKVEEITYGPYEDAASQEQWGYQPATFTMQGSEDATAIAAKANAILAANAQPQKMISAVLVPIRYVEDLHPGKALLDLYDLVQLGYERTGTSRLARVTQIKHTITAKGGWKMELGFSANGTVAPPQVVASPPPVASGGVVTATATYGMGRLGANASIPHNGWTNVITWVDVEKSGLSFASGVWTATTAGRYKVHFTVSFANNSTGIRGIRPVLGGSPDLNVLSAPTPGFQTTMDVSVTVRLAAGTTIGCQVFQNSGAALNALGDAAGLYSKADLERVSD